MKNLNAAAIKHYTKFAAVSGLYLSMVAGAIMMVAVDGSAMSVVCCAMAAALPLNFLSITRA
jgi:hypothetical protein